MKRLFYILFLIGTSFINLSAQIIDADGLYVDTVFHDHINRQADDFVRVILCTTDPTNWNSHLTDLTGDAWLQLQCEAYDLDYCFLYETQPNALLHLLRNDLEIKMVTIPTKKHIQSYRAEKKTIHAYKVNLPSDAKQRLWELLDMQVEKETTLAGDIVRSKSTLNIIQVINQSLQGKQIQYNEWPSELNKTRYEIIQDNLQSCPWIQLFSELTLDDKFRENCSKENMLITPDLLVKVWSRATLDNHPLIEYQGDLIETEPCEFNKTRCSPLYISLILLVMTICFAFTKWVYWDWLMIGLQAVIGVPICYFMISSAFTVPNSIVLSIVFNPLPALTWKWRKYWSAWYGILLIIWLITINLFPWGSVNVIYQILSIILIILFVKDSIGEKLKNAKTLH